MKRKIQEIIEIEKHNGLKYAQLGMNEDWSATYALIWADGDFFEGFNERLIRGISSSAWATPLLLLIYENYSIQEKTDEITFFDESVKVSDEEIAVMKGFHERLQ